MVKHRLNAKSPPECHHGVSLRDALKKRHVQSIRKEQTLRHKDRVNSAREQKSMLLEDNLSHHLSLWLEQEREGMMFEDLCAGHVKICFLLFMFASFSVITFPNIFPCPIQVIRHPVSPLVI